MAGSSTITYKTVQGQKFVQSVFSETDSKNARSWTLFFNSKKGVYRVNLNVQGTEEELSKYQPIFAYLFSTFEFVK